MPRTLDRPPTLRLILLSSFALVSSACDPAGAGEPDDLGEQNDAIVGGSAFRELPAIGAILIDYQHGSGGCTGTLITPRKVLTAAHCVVAAERMKFSIGNNVKDPTQVIDVIEARRHPKYDPRTLEADVGLLILAHDAPVEPLRINHSVEWNDWIHRPLLHVGYGITNGKTFEGWGTKRAVLLKIDHINGGFFEIEDPNDNTCAGDSGGPALRQDSRRSYRVAAVTSGGDLLCERVALDTRVDLREEFIGQTINDSTDKCAGETFDGRCEGTAVVWCENNRVKRRDCSNSSKVCGFVAADGFVGCR